MSNQQGRTNLANRNTQNISFAKDTKNLVNGVYVYTNRTGGTKGFANRAIQTPSHSVALKHFVIMWAGQQNITYG
jgi:hypothetical protein